MWRVFVYEGLGKLTQNILHGWWQNYTGVLIWLRSWANYILGTLAPKSMGWWMATCIASDAQVCSPLDHPFLVNVSICGRNLIWTSIIIRSNIWFVHLYYDNTKLISGFPLPLYSPPARYMFWDQRKCQSIDIFFHRLHCHSSKASGCDPIHGSFLSD